MKKYIVEPGTMLYDAYTGKIGWVVGKRKCYADNDAPMSPMFRDWDVESSVLS